MGCWNAGGMAGCKSSIADKPAEDLNSQMKEEIESGLAKAVVKGQK